MWPFSRKRVETIEPDRVEYYRVNNRRLPHVVYRYEVNNGKWSYWDERHFDDACWTYYDLTKEEVQNLKEKIPRTNKLEVLLVCGPEAVKG